MFPVFDEQLARHLGLEELRVGARRSGARAGTPQVLAWWSVSVEPSFDPSWVVGAVHEEHWTGGPTPDRLTARGFVADAEGAATAPLEDDEVLEALASLNPFRVEPARRVPEFGRNGETWYEMATADGLGYRVRWGTKATEGAFRFSNPEAVWLVEFERVLFRFARRVVSASGASRFEDQLRCWAGYREAVGDV